MKREEIIELLAKAPATIREAEQSLLAAVEAHRSAEAALEITRARYLNGQMRTEDGTWVTPNEPVITGKNAEAREAQLRIFTEREAKAVAEAQAEVDRRRIVLRSAENEFRAVRSVALLIAGTEVSA